MNPLMFTLLGRQAAATFVKTGAPLNGSIAKLAEEHSLSRLHIQRVVESANHEANDTLRKTASDQTYTFSLASLDGVLAELNRAPEGLDVTKLAGIISDTKQFRGRDTLDKLAETLPTESLDAPERRRKETEIAIAKTASRSQMYSDQIKSSELGELEKLSENLNDMVQTAKDYMLMKRGSFGDLQKYATLAFPEMTKGWGVIFGQVESELLKLGHPFTGALAKEKEMSKDTKGRHTPTPGITPEVINGKSALYGGLKAIRDRVSVVDRMNDRHRALDNFNGTIRTYQKVLHDNADVDTEMHKLAQELELVSQNEDELIALFKTASIGDAVVVPAMVGATLVNEAGKKALKVGKKVITADNVPARFASSGTAKVYAGDRRR
jgi:hypothetical protein